MSKLSFIDFDNGGLLGLDLDHYLSEVRVLERLGRGQHAKEFGPYTRRYRAIYDQAIMSLAGQITDFTELRVALRPYYSDWQNTYILLLKYLLDSGYSFRPMQSFKEDDIETKTGFLRYDIHCRDLPGLYGYLDVNKAFNLPSNAYIFWEYSAREKEFGQYFEALNHIQKQSNCTLGFHTSAVDSHLIWSKFDGDEREQIQWLKSKDGEVFFDTLLKNDAAKADLVGAADAHFDRQAADFKAHFPEGYGLAAHGGGIGWMLREVYGVAPAQIGVKPENEKIDALWQAISARGYLANGAIERSGLGYDTDAMPYFHKYEPISDSVRNVDLFLDMFDRAIERGKAAEVLLHPATFSSTLGHWDLHDAICRRKGVSPQDKQHFVKVGPVDDDSLTDVKGRVQLFNSDETVIPEKVSFDLKGSGPDASLNIKLSRSMSDKNSYIRGLRGEFPFQAGKMYRVKFSVSSHEDSLFLKPWLTLLTGEMKEKGQMIRFPFEALGDYRLTFICAQSVDSFDFMLELGGRGSVSLANRIDITELEFPYIVPSYQDVLDS